MPAAPAAPAVQAPAAVAAQPAAAPKKKKGKGRLVLLLILAGATAYGAYAGREWWTHGRFMVETDDAYVATDITTLAAKVSGYVDKVDVAPNTHVKAGDPILHLDAGDYELAVAAARDKIATQDATIDRIGRQVEAADASVRQADAQITSAKADLEVAEADYARTDKLVETKVASTAQMDSARAARDRAVAGVTAAEAALAAAEANVEVLKAQQVEASHVRAELATALDKAERDLSFTVIRAPVDGVVGNRAVEEGSYVQPGQRLAALVPLASVHVDANFKETQLAGLKPGQTVELTVDALPGRTIEGTVESFSPATGSVFSLLPPENATGNFTKVIQRVPVRIAVPADVAAEGLLRPGMSVIAGVDTRTGDAPARTAAR
nr:HlyD family secretion protein [Oharaeibacter diazotrophicus]